MIYVTAKIFFTRCDIIYRLTLESSVSLLSMIPEVFETKKERFENAGVFLKGQTRIF